MSEKKRGEMLATIELALKDSVDEKVNTLAKNASDGSIKYYYKQAVAGNLGIQIDHKEEPWWVKARRAK